jgi:hypothetical protein
MKTYRNAEKSPHVLFTSALDGTKSHVSSPGHIYPTRRTSPQYLINRNKCYSGVVKIYASYSGSTGFES